MGPGRSGGYGRSGQMSRFRRLTITHAAMMGGDAAMLVALADSLFLSIDPSAARSRVLLFLIISFAPFLVVAPLIGPAIDRAAGGRRTVIQLIAGTRVVLALAIAASLHSLRLFPLVFVALVLQKAYIVSKQALVPSVVRSDAELVEANSKLGVISGLTGFVAIIPAALIHSERAGGVPCPRDVLSSRTLPRRSSRSIVGRFTERPFSF